MFAQTASAPSGEFWTAIGVVLVALVGLIGVVLENGRRNRQEWRGTRKELEGNGGNTDSTGDRIVRIEQAMNYLVDAVGRLRDDLTAAVRRDDARFQAHGDRIDRLSKWLREHEHDDKDDQ